MKARKMLLVAAMLIFGGSTAAFQLHKQTIPVVDGQKSEHTAFAWTVGWFLRANGYSVGPHDTVSPGPEATLQEGERTVLEEYAGYRIFVDDRVIDLATTENVPVEVLNQAGVDLEQWDLVLANGVVVDPLLPLSGSNTYSIQVQRAVRVEVSDGDEQYSFISTAPTLGQALAEQGIPLYEADLVDPPVDTPLSRDSKGNRILVNLDRSQPLVIHHGGGSLQHRTAAKTVGEALAEAGLSLQGLDYSIPSSDSSLPEDGSVRVVRVREVVQIEQEPIPFESDLEPAPEVELDQREVIRPGEYGILARSLRIRYEDGIPVSEQVEDQWSASEPKDQIVGYGTKIVVRTLDTPGGPIEYWRALQMYATSYSPCRIYDDRCDDYTALGYTLQKGVVAMTNYWCRTTCGDRVYVPGYGVGVVADTGGGIPGRYWIDLGYSEEDYVSWHQWVTVYFLTPVPANLMWVLP